MLISPPPGPRSLLKAPVIAGVSKHRDQMKQQLKSASFVSDTLLHYFSLFPHHSESTAIVTFFFRLFPDEVNNISFCGVRGGDGNPFDLNVLQDKYRKWLYDFVVVSTIGLCGETPQATSIAKCPILLAVVSSQVLLKSGSNPLHNGNVCARYSPVLGHFFYNCIYDLAKHPSRSRYIIPEIVTSVAAEVKGANWGREPRKYSLYPICSDNTYINYVSLTGTWQTMINLRGRWKIW